MPTLSCIKTHAAGNDLLFVIDPDGDVQLSAEQVRLLCDRHRGVGASGLVRAVQTQALPQYAKLLREEPDAVWFLEHFGADGAAAELNGSALISYAHVLLSEGLSATERRDTLPISTRFGIHDVLQGAGGYSVDMGRWRMGAERLLGADGLRVARPALTVKLGSDCVVTVLASVDDLHRLRFSVPPSVDAEPIEQAMGVWVAPDETVVRNGVGQIHLRSFADGAGEVLSSANAAAAAALVFRHWGGSQMPHHWSVTQPGGRLGVRMFPTEEGEHVSVSGSVETVFRAEVALPE